MAAVAGLRGTGDWGADERPKNFRELILFRNPNGTAPIFALSAKVSKSSTDDPEFSWWDEPNDIVRLTVVGSHAAAVTTITIDSSDPSVGSPTLNWGLATHLKNGDLLLVEPAVDAVTFNNEVLRVVSVVSGTEFVVERGAAGSTAATIANDASLLLIGSAYPEGVGAPRATSRNPVKYGNYTQIFKDTYELTGTAAKTRLRTGDALKNDKKRKAFDHARAIEMSILFGRKSETVGDNGKPLRTMDGIRRFIPGTNTTVFTAGANWDLNDLMAAIAPVFDFDTEAGDTRIAFVGNIGLTAINQHIMTASGQSATNINFNGMTKVYGMNFNEFVLPQGRILLKTHPLLNRHPLYRNSMLLMDFSALKWRPMADRDTKFKDDIQSEDEDVRRGMWMTEAGIEVAYGGLTMGWIGGLDASA